MPKSQRNKSFQGKRDKAGSKSPISCVVTPGNSYKFSITIWTETGIGEYEVGISRIKGGEGGSKKEGCSSYQAAIRGKNWLSAAALCK